MKIECIFAYNNKQKWSDLKMTVACIDSTEQHPTRVKSRQVADGSEELAVVD